MRLEGPRCTLRPYRMTDADRLVELAGEFTVARWMTASFPHPYTPEQARAWLTRTTAEAAVGNFAIEVDGRLAGGAGLEPQTGEHRGVAEFGYWLGRPYWGRGLATEAARVLVTHAFEMRELRRLQAHVFAGNHASARVLEKNGFVREAVLRASYVERDGTVVDGWLYARLRDDPWPAP